MSFYNLYSTHDARDPVGNIVTQKIRCTQCSNFEFELEPYKFNTHPWGSPQSTLINNENNAIHRRNHDKTRKVITEHVKMAHRYKECEHCKSLVLNLRQHQKTITCEMNRRRNALEAQGWTSKWNEVISQAIDLMVKRRHELERWIDFSDPEQLYAIDDLVNNFVRDWCASANILTAHTTHTRTDNTSRWERVYWCDRETDNMLAIISALRDKKHEVKQLGYAERTRWVCSKFIELQGLPEGKRDAALAIWDLQADDK